MASWMLAAHAGTSSGPTLIKRPRVVEDRDPVPPLKEPHRHNRKHREPPIEELCHRVERPRCRVPRRHTLSMQEHRLRGEDDSQNDVSCR